MRDALYRFADDVPGWIAYPLRAIFLAVGLVGFGIFFVGLCIVSGVEWFYDQVRG